MLTRSHRRLRRTEVATRQSSPSIGSAATPPPSVTLEKAGRMAFVESEPARVTSAMRAMEAALSDPSARAVKVEKIAKKSANSVYKVTLSNGAVGIWKPISGEAMVLRPLSLPPLQQARREVATYVVDRAMGHSARVPPKVLRQLRMPDGTTRKGALIAYVDYMLGRTLDGMDQDTEKQRRYSKIGLLDNVVGNLDPRYDQMIWLHALPIPIDHGLTFPVRHGFGVLYANVVWKFGALSSEDLESLRKLFDVRETVSQELRTLGLSPRSIRLMWDRASRILDEKKTSHFWLKS